MTAPRNGRGPITRTATEQDARALLRQIEAEAARLWRHKHRLAALSLYRTCSRLADAAMASRAAGHGNGGLDYRVAVARRRLRWARGLPT